MFSILICFPAILFQVTYLLHYMKNRVSTGINSMQFYVQVSIYSKILFIPFSLRLFLLDSSKVIFKMWKRLLHKLPRKSIRRYKKLVSCKTPSNSQCSFDSNYSCNSASIQVGTTSNSTTAPAPAPTLFEESSKNDAFEPLVPFKDVGDCEKMTLFISKLSLCCTIFDFTKPSTNTCEKDLKTTILAELIEFVTYNSSNYSEPAILAVCKMCSMNLFRDFPPHVDTAATHNDVVDDDDEHEPRFDPAWPHLQLVYDLLVKFVSSSSLETKAAKKYINYPFLLRLLDLFDSEDPRERECLKILLHKIYGKFIGHRSFIRKNMSYIFYEYVLDIGKHNGITELLEILGSVIAGFALPLKPEFKLLLCKVLIPLHKPKSLGVYIQQLTYCITQYIDKEPKLASRVISGMLKFWPKTNSRKEVMFLSELEEILETIEMAEFQKVMIPLFQRIGCCMSSYNFQVSERAMLLWHNQQFVNLIEENRQVILPIIFPALEHNIECHWNQIVLNLTFDIRKMFQEMDMSLFDDCHSHYEKEKENLSLTIEKQREEEEQMENSVTIEPVIKETVVLLTPIKTSILC